MISVIVPTFNRESIILSAINSIQQQTYRDWELIIIDDGSKDNTERLVKDIIPHDSRIKYYRFPNMGASVARNIGIGLAINDYVAFLDSDDSWSRNRLQMVAERIISKPGKLYLTNFKRSGEEKLLFRKDYLTSNHFNQILLAANVLGGTINIVASKSTLMSISGFDTGLSSCQDHDIFVRLTNENEIEFIDGAYAEFTVISKNRITGKNWNKLNGHLSYYKKHHGKMNFLAKIIQHKKIGVYYFYLKNPKTIFFFPSWLVANFLKFAFKVDKDIDLFFVKHLKFLMNK